MTSRVAKSAAAKRDLTDLFVYLWPESPDAAERFADAAEVTFEALASSPGIGRVWKSRVAGIGLVRVWPVTGFRRHLVFYRPRAGGIDVLRVIHGARDLERIRLERGAPNEGA